jgi:CheY-like chemotaxis protein
MNPTVLVVEDEPDGQEVVCSILEHHNIASESVGTAEQAIEILSTRRFNAIIIDFALPRMDGLTLLKTIRSAPAMADIPCLVVTAFHTSSIKRQFLDAGANGYLTKPVSGEDLVREVNRLVG